MRTIARQLSWKRTTARPLHLLSTTQKRMRTFQPEWTSRWAWSTWSTSKRSTTPTTSSSSSDYSGLTIGGRPGQFSAHGYCTVLSVLLLAINLMQCTVQCPCDRLSSELQKWMNFQRWIYDKNICLEYKKSTKNSLDRKLTTPLPPRRTLKIHPGSLA